MSMVKTCRADGWGYDGLLAQTIPWSSRGLVGADRLWMQKRASAAFVDALQGLEIPSDQHPVHAITVGAYEGWGLNRNGDFFREPCCQKYASTFTDYGHPYRNHVNRDPAKSYGVIKHAGYNPDMRRIELLILYNKQKSAADRHKNLVADRELEKLARKEDLPFSMACSVTHDVCNFCNNHARTRADYCTSSTCKAGGCRDNLAKVIKVGNDIIHLGVDNPVPRWFDNSLVIKPAERTAYGNTATYLLKAASDEEAWVGGALAAEELAIEAPLRVKLAEHLAELDGEPQHQALIKLAYALSLLEQLPQQRRYKEAFWPSVQGAPEVEWLGEAGTEEFRRGLGAIANEHAILPLRDFARAVKAAAPIADEAQQLMPRLYRQLMQEGVSFQHQDRTSVKVASPQQRFRASLLHDSHSLAVSALRERSLLSGLRAQPQLTKSAAEKVASPAARELARRYGHYQLSALEQISRFDPQFPLTARAAILHNQS